MELGRVGLWTSALDRQPAAAVRDAVAEIETLGYRTLWVGEAARREAFANAALLLSASTRLVVATGIANIWVRDPMAMAAGQRTLSEAWGGRFVLGVGVSHDPLEDVSASEERHDEITVWVARGDRWGGVCRVVVAAHGLGGAPDECSTQPR